jgi:hypothetical protein
LDYIGAHRTIWPAQLSKGTQEELEGRPEMQNLHQFLQSFAPSAGQEAPIGDKPAKAAASPKPPRAASLEAAQKAGLKSFENIFEGLLRTFSRTFEDGSKAERYFQCFFRTFQKVPFDYGPSKASSGTFAGLQRALKNV